ncbi:MAG: DUF5685 family protein [Lachnospiraceae bacterium]|nr:DUF5685 family protein [Lachnospiraceae bacterium]
MFGYIYINEQELKLREYTTYRSFYCGLCQELHRRYGRRAQLVLNYDTTFLAILLTGLYEPETTVDESRCLLHPVHKHQMARNDAIGYAADMCVLLAYQKGLDDWEDEHRPSGRILSSLLESAYKKIVDEYPRQAKAVEENIGRLHEIEAAWKARSAASGSDTGSEAEAAREESSDTKKVYGAEPVCDGRGSAPDAATDIDYVAGLTGNFLAELFVWKDDLWQDDLRQIGFYLGKFIYLMDALEDIEKDKKHGNYNVFAAALGDRTAEKPVEKEKGASPGQDALNDMPDGGGRSIWADPYREEIQKILTGMMTEASRAFERLPVLMYAPIIRNILYSGVWCKYSMLQEKAGGKKKDQAKTGVGGDYERSI